MGITNNTASYVSQKISTEIPQSGANENPKAGNAGTWLVNGICRQVRLFSEAVLWSCTSSNFKSRNAKWMPSSFSRAQTDCGVPKHLQDKLDAIRSKPTMSSRFGFFKLTVKFLRPFKGYCLPKISARTMEAKVAANLEKFKLLGGKLDSRAEASVNKFVADFVISRAKTRGEDISLVKQWLGGERHDVKGAENAKLANDYALAKTRANDALEEALEEVEFDFDFFGTMPSTESVSPLEYSRFAKNAQKYTTMSGVRKEIRVCLETGLKKSLKDDAARYKPEPVVPGNPQPVALGRVETVVNPSQVLGSEAIRVTKDPNIPKTKLHDDLKVSKDFFFVQ